MIQLEIKKPLYREYISFLFEQQEDGRYKVTRESDFGKALCSFVRYSHGKQEKIHEAVSLVLPDSDSVKNAKNYHCYFSREDTRRLNDLLDVFFHIDFDRFYLNGRKLGIMQKDIIESFIISRKLTNLLNDNETLKKRQYREEIQLLQQRTKILSRKAWYRNERIEENIKGFLVN